MRGYPDEWKYKTVSEELDHEFDFFDEVPSGDTIKAILAGDTDVTAVDSAGTDVSATLIGAKALGGTKLKARIKAGTDGEDYVVTYTAEMTTSGERRQKFLFVSVRNPSFIG